MKTKIDNIISFAKNEQPKAINYSYCCFIEKDNDISIGALYKNSDIPNMFFRAFGNPYQPTDEEISTAIKKYIDAGGKVL